MSVYGFTVAPQGESVVVAVQNAQGVAVPFYYDPACTHQASGTVTVSTLTPFYLASAGTIFISLKVSSTEWATLHNQPLALDIRGAVPGPTVAPQGPYIKYAVS